MVRSSLYPLILVCFLTGCATTLATGRGREPAQIKDDQTPDSFTGCMQLGADVAAKGGKLTVKPPQTWSQSQMSDPKNHDPKNFTYIVHAIGSDLFELKNPEIGTFADYIWASIISSDAPYTYMRGSGIILAIEPDNMVSNSCYDTGFQMPVGEGAESKPGQLDEGFGKYRALHKQLTPKQMLAATIWPHVMNEDEAQKYGVIARGPMYLDNEMILKGRGNAGSVVRTIGVFINTKDPYPLTVAPLREFAAKYSLPIIEVNP